MNVKQEQTAAAGAFNPSPRPAGKLTLVASSQAPRLEEDEDEPLPETIEGCDAEIEDLEETVDSITVQIEMADKGLTHQGDYEEWRQRAIGALYANRKELHQLYRQKNRLEYEERTKRASAQWKAKGGKAGLTAKSAEYERSITAEVEARRQAEHERKMERIRLSNDRNTRRMRAICLWLSENSPDVWEEVKAHLDALDADEAAQSQQAAPETQEQDNDHV